MTQVEPQEQTGDESCRGWPEVAQPSLAIAHVVARQGGGVDTHVSEQRPKIQYLGSEPVGNQKGSAQRDEAHEDHVIARNAVLRVEGPKNPGGRALLRPMPYRSLAAPKWEPTPEPIPAIRSARFIATKSQGPVPIV